MAFEMSGHFLSLSINIKSFIIAHSIGISKVICGNFKRLWRYTPDEQSTVLHFVVGGKVKHNEVGDDYRNTLPKHPIWTRQQE